MNPPPNRGFVTTRWTLVVAASREATPESREALSQLCELYWPPLYGFARRRGYSIEQAQDLTQSFFARFLEKHDVKTADPQRGRFRSFLLGAFKHFLANEYDREQTRKRGGGHVFRALGTTEGAIKVTVHRLRRRFRHVLRAQITATVSDDAEIDDEIRYLLAAL